MTDSDRPVLLRNNTDKKFLAAAQRLRSGLDVIQERWDNRYVLNPSTLFEDYINGRFELLAYEDRRIGADDVNLICRITAAPTVDECVSSCSEVNVLNLRDSNSRDDEIMFVIVVEVTDGAKRVTLPVRVCLQVVPNKVCSVRHGLLYVTVGAHRYEVFNIAAKRHRKAPCSLRLSECFDAGRGPVVEAGSQIVNDVTNAESEVLRDWFQRSIAQLKGVRFFPRSEDSNFVQIVGQAGTFRDQGIKVALGPFNL